MTLDYFYGQAGELFAFYRIPKALFQEPQFQTLSTDAKTLYGILLDRMSLSVKNGWLDEQGRVFIIFTIEDVKRALCCADNKATKLLRELEKFGLIERKRRGLGKPSLVYAEENCSFPDFSLCGVSSSDGKVAANPVQLCSRSADALHLRLRHLHGLPSDLESVLYPAGGRVHLLHPLFRCNCHHRGHRAVQ